MSRTGFVCPDGEKVSFEECFAACRMGERCVPLPYLAGMRMERKLDGFSVTELAQPAVQMALKMTRKYHEAPEDLTFAFRSTAKHFVLQVRGEANSLVEERVAVLDGVSGQPDLYDEREGVTDFKSWAWYKVRKALEQKEAHGGLAPVFADGTLDFGQDFQPEVFQLNCYRLGMERLGFSVPAMQLWVLVRDFGWMTKKQGSERQWYRIPVLPVEDAVLEATLRLRKAQLEEALRLARTSELTEPCPKEETWDGKRCEAWCAVREHCPRPWG